jgi:N-acetylneuraminic acid mutarotase
MAAATCASEVLVVFGGQDSKLNLLKSIIIYNPTSDSWTKLMDTLPRAWAGLEAFYNSGSVYLVGGITDLNTEQGAKINNQ